MMKHVSRAMAEESEQRCHPGDEACLFRHEKIRLGVLYGSLCVMLLSSVSFAVTRNILPLFFTTVVVFSFYKCLNTIFEHSEHVLLHPK